MKTKTLLITLFLGCLTAFAQMAVTAPVLEKTALQELGETLKQTKENTEQTLTLKNNYKLLKEATEALEKVSHAIENVHTIKEIYKTHTHQVAKANALYNRLNQLDQNKSATFIKNHREGMDNLMLSSQDYIKMAQSLVSTGSFKMSDAERMNLIFKIEEKINGIGYGLERVEDNINRKYQLEGLSKFLDQKNQN